MQSFSFYYRDSIDLKVLFPKAIKFSLLFPDDNVIIENGIMRLKDPESFDPSKIRSIVRVYPHQYDYFKVEVKVRCWREETFFLQEITRYAWFKKSPIYKLMRRIIKHILPVQINTHLFTRENISYFCHNQYLYRKQNGASVVMGKMPKLNDPIYYELLPFHSDFFLRTGGSIYMSRESLAKWIKIYEGKRAIKNSMIWIEEEKALLFSEYTPGLNLCRHHLYKYYIDSGETRIILTFYSPDEFEKEGKTPHCRHIHILVRDPFTNDIYLGVGDADDESAIYRSTDNGNNFSLVGRGNQLWRTLSFFFTKESVFWNTDSPDPQYLNCVNRKQLNSLPILTKNVKHWPLFNSASWNSTYDERNDLYVMSASCEGTLYDNVSRIYGIRFNKDIPTVYSLFEDKSGSNLIVSRNYQLFLLGIDTDGTYWFYDTRRHFLRQFVLIIK